jgi:hypothetical protein
MMLQPRVRGFLMAGGCRLISWMYRWSPLSPAWSAPGVSVGRCPVRTMTGRRYPSILAPGEALARWRAGGHPGTGPRSVPLQTSSISPAPAVAAQGAGIIDLISRPGASRMQQPAGMPLRLPHWQVSWASVRPCPSPTILWCSGLGEALARWRAGGCSCHSLG